MFERLSLSAILICTLLCSCTVKEDRGPCPCLLNLFLEDSADYSDKLTVSGWDMNSERLFHDKILHKGHPDLYSRKVKKGFLTVSAFCGAESMAVKDDCLVIPEGKNGDRLWAFAGGPVDARGENAEEHIFLHKQYADVHIRVDELSREAGDIIIRATSNTDGLSLLTLKPRAGSFKCYVPQENESEWSFTVPRQRDESLELEVYLNGVLRKKVSVGELIRINGYSWSKTDLDDIYISINLVSDSPVQIAITGWDTEKVSYTI